MRTVRHLFSTSLRAVVTAGLAVTLAGAASAVLAVTGQGPGAGAAGVVPGTAVPDLLGAVDLGAVAPSVPMTVTMDLALRDQAGLAQVIAAEQDPASTQYRHYLTPATFAATYGPSPATAAAVEQWADGAGLTVSGLSANRTLVTVTGTAARLGQAFATTFASYRQATTGQTFTAITRPASVPSALSGDLAAVVGLTSLGRLQLAPVVRPSAATLASSGLSFPASYGPQGLWSFYNAPAAQTGAGQTIAVLAEGDLAQPQADLATFEHDNDLPSVPWTTVPTGPASTDTSGDDEWDLDTQYSTGLAQDVASLLVYDAPSLDDSDILAELTKWVTDDRARAANFSAGECELLADTDGFVTAGDQTLEQAVAQGQTLFAAAGDTGAFCPVGGAGVNGVPAGLPDVNYPAASPYAVAVGGTTIVGGPAPLREIGWYAGGGGQSVLETEPADQSGVGGSNLGVFRGVPDVAFDADPNSGFNVIVDGQATVVGGTSGSSPSWLGIWARAQAAHGSDLGFAGHVIYAEPAGAFNDITVGDNVGYPCTPGYDYVTGRGTPDIAAFIAGA